VKRRRGTHEDVVTAMFGVETKLARHLLEVIDYVVCLLLWRSACFLSCAFDVDAVFVSARKKVGFDAALSLGARNRVSHDHRVKMTEVRQTVGVVNWCSDVKSVHLLTIVFRGRIFLRLLRELIPRIKPGLLRHIGDAATDYERNLRFLNHATEIPGVAHFIGRLVIVC
jgi:hypothetical protein